MKLLREEIDCANIEAEILAEGGTGKKSYYIKGPFIVAEAKNRNGRIYPAGIIEREVNRFIKEKIDKGMGGGELNHPQSPEVNPERISHYIKELTRDGNIWVGKAKVSNAPMGRIVQSLLDDDYKLGVSTRGLGTVQPKGTVNEDYKMITVDIVGNPSAPGAFVDPVLENKDYIIQDDGTIVEAFKSLESKIKTLPKRDVESYLNQAIREFLRKMPR